MQTITAQEIKVGQTISFPGRKRPVLVVSETYTAIPAHRMFLVETPQGYSAVCLPNTDLVFLKGE